MIQPSQIADAIHLLRGQKAILYGVPTGKLNRAVKRNRSRFPSDFMFRLAAEESEILKCQFGISRWGGRRGLPYAFTEQGVAMLSSVLTSERAVKVNIAIMRAFVESGERTRLACWRWRPRRRELASNRWPSDFGSLIKKCFSASRRKEHAGRVRSPIRRR